jgi:hypothetical protein
VLPVGRGAGLIGSLAVVFPEGSFRCNACRQYTAFVDGSVRQCNLPGSELVYPNFIAVLQGTFRNRGQLVCAMLVSAWACIVTMGADQPVTPMGVCEVLRDIPALAGKDLAVVGRYSFRADGRWMSEQACDAPAAAPPELWLVEDSKEAPRLPEHFEIDAIALHKKLLEIERRTSLGKFRFGTPDYDRWAVVYGRVEARKGDQAKKAPANLLFRGSGVVVFLAAE